MTAPGGKLDRPVTEEGAAAADGVSWRRVRVTYDGSPPVTALQATDLDLRRGDQVAVVGPSGSGKSTLLNVLGLLDRPTSGTYMLFGVDVGSLTERARAALRATEIGFVFQSFKLLQERTAIENVVLGMRYSQVPRSQRAAQAAWLLERVGLFHRMSARCATLSGGESQRVAIARALAHSPRLLLADEPTGNLDQRTGASILALLDELRSPDLVQVIVTHDKVVAGRFERQIEIVDGRLTMLR